MQDYNAFTDTVQPLMRMIDMKFSHPYNARLKLRTLSPYSARADSFKT